MNSTDLAIINGKVGSSDPTADFDGNGVVNAADVSYAQGHAGHSCPNVVGAAHRSWGAVKIIYR